MLLNLFSNIFGSTTQTNISVFSFMVCIISSLLVGVFLAVAYTYKTRHTKSFVITLATLPAIVSVVIIMVNGNLGAGVAVAGAFSLVRFRSAPGTAKEIGAIFLAMATGLAFGMGYIGLGVLFAVIVVVANHLYTISSFGEQKANFRSVTITIPEDLDYTTVFDDLFMKYANTYEIINVKTTNMGSMFKLKYEIELKDSSLEKEFIDQLRCRNGNLEIVFSRVSLNIGEL